MLQYVIMGIVVDRRREGGWEILSSLANFGG